MAKEVGRDKFRVDCVVSGWAMMQRQISLWLADAGEQAMGANHCIRLRNVCADIAHMTIFLVADTARMITAQEFVVDAGWSLADPVVRLARRRRLMDAKVPGSSRHYH